MIRLIVIAFLVYVVFRMLNTLIFPILKGNFGASKSNANKADKSETDKDWGGKYVEYEEIKEDKKPGS